MASVTVSSLRYARDRKRRVFRESRDGRSKRSEAACRNLPPPVAESKKPLRHRAALQDVQAVSVQDQRHGGLGISRSNSYWQALGPVEGPLGLALPPVGAPHFRSGAKPMVSMTRACDPPRSKTFPRAATCWPANSIKRGFCPVAGIASEMGQ